MPKPPKMPSPPPPTPMPVATDPTIRNAARNTKLRMIANSGGDEGDVLGRGGDTGTPETRSGTTTVLG